jgi:hypothetical protein
MAVDVGDGFADGAFVEDALLVNHAGQEGGGAKEVNLAGDALGVIEDAAQRVVAEELAALKAGDPDVVLDISNGVLQVEGLEMVADGQALVEGLVAGQAQGVAQDGLADQEQRGQGMAVHLVRQQQAELLKGISRQQVGLVDDQQGEAAPGLDQVAEGGADGGHQLGPAVGGLVMQGRQDIALETIHANGWIRQVDEEKAVGVELGGETANGRGLAGANLARDQA